MSDSEIEPIDYEALYHIAVEARSQMREELGKSARSNASFVKENHALRAQLLALREAARDVGCFLRWAADHEMRNGGAQMLSLNHAGRASKELTVDTALDALTNACTSSNSANEHQAPLRALGAGEHLFPTHSTFAFGQRVEKRSGSQWHGKVVGFYSTGLTPEGYCIESEREQGSVQIYPAKALTPAKDTANE